MAYTIKYFEDLGVDVFQAMKRAFMRRGTLPPNVQHAQPKHHKQNTSALGSLPVTDEEVSPASAEVKEASGSSKHLEETDKKAEEGPEEMVEITDRVHEVLYEADTVFPFTLFPDTITLDREKLTFARRTFWRVAEITSVPISEILSCKVNVGPFFGSLHLVFSFFADNQKAINFLWRDDAIKMQRMIHGYIIAQKREINTTNISLEDLKVLLEEIGQGAAE